MSDKKGTIKTFEFDEVCESRDFNHDHLFVNYTDHREEVLSLQANVTALTDRLREAEEVILEAKETAEAIREPTGMGAESDQLGNVAICLNLERSIAAYLSKHKGKGG